MTTDTKPTADTLPILEEKLTDLALRFRPVIAAYRDERKRQGKGRDACGTFLDSADGALKEYLQHKGIDQ